MSAIKHLKAKTVYISKNSKTDKRRNFAIIGFESNKDLQKALSSYVELFRTKTWWSTKDNQRINSKETRMKTKCKVIQKPIEEEEEESDCMSIISNLDSSIHDGYSDSSISTYNKKDQK